MDSLMENEFSYGEWIHLWEMHEPLIVPSPSMQKGGIPRCHCYYRWSASPPAGFCWSQQPARHPQELGLASKCPTAGICTRSRMPQLCQYLWDAGATHMEQVPGAGGVRLTEAE